MIRCELWSVSLPQKWTMYVDTPLTDKEFGKSESENEEGWFGLKGSVFVFRSEFR